MARTPPPPSTPAPLPTFVTDGQVNALAAGDGRVFAGGSFSRIGPLTGGAVAVDPATALRDTTFPRVTGTVFALTPDGAGGVFLGGNFSAVGGLPRANLAHVLAGGAVDPGFNPQPDGQVLGMAISGGELYFGGDFLHVGATIRRRLAAVSLPTPSSPVAQLDTSFNPGVDGSVQDIAAVGTRLYIDGRFQGVAGQSREGIAAIDAHSGQLDSGFDVSINGPVDALLVLGGRLYAGGLFSDVGGHSRAGLVAFDAVTGALDPSFSPATNGQVYDLATDGTNLFVAGRFTEIGRAFDNSVASLDPATGAANQPFRFFADKDAYAVTYAAGKLYIGGEFTTINNQPGNRLVAVDATTGAIAPGFDPDPDNDVYAVALVGNELIAGGKFISAPRTVASNLAAIDAATGVAVPGFSAGVSGKPAEDRGGRATILSLALAGGRLYAGGSFGSADGAPRNDLASFDPATGALRGTPPFVDGSVYALAAAGRRVYVGGRFAKAGTGHYPALLALDAASGALVAPFNFERPSTRLVKVLGSHGRTTHVRRKVLLPSLLMEDGSVDALLAEGNRVFVGGDDVTSVAQVGKGRKRHSIVGLLALSAASGGLIPAFETPVDSGVEALAATGRTLYAGGQFDVQIGTRLVHRKHGKPFRVGVYRENLVALDTAHGRPRATFAANADDEVTALATDGNELYVGGSFRHLGGRPRVRVAAVSPGAGRLSTTFTPAPNAAVEAFALLGTRLFAGGAFSAVGSGPQPYLAAFQPPASGPAPGT